jgi:hypothetical protein
MGSFVAQPFQVGHFGFMANGLRQHSQGQRIHKRNRNAYASGDDEFHFEKAVKQFRFTK